MKSWQPLPQGLSALVECTPATVLLECAKPAASAADPFDPTSYSRFFTAPLRILEANNSAELAALFAEIEQAVAAGHQAAGFFSYECGNCFEPKANQRPSPPGQPLAWFGIYDHCYRYDHLTGSFLDGEPPGLAQFPDSVESLPELPTEPLIEAAFTLGEEQYSARIAEIHEWIRSGDVYQLNFTHPMQLRLSVRPAALYAHLRRRQPVAYGGFLHWRLNRQILSFSPELFFRLENVGGERRITAQPMKGTAPRGRFTQEDQDLAEWLRNDAKNRSENLMIVDLLRNDLGRLCNFGSVSAAPLFAVERHPTLWQMTSTISGTLRPEVDYQQIFRALFPCGSITGAPKLRAMQLIAQLEAQPRGIYTGAIGYFSRERTLFNVAIRTIDLNGEQGEMGIGSGIVIDSDAADEFRECQLKAEFLTRSAAESSESFSLIETLLWRESFLLIELHLDRLADSADYFDFPFDRAETKRALLDCAAAFADRKPRKIRLLLSSDGRLQLTDELLPEASIELPLRVRIASQRTDPRNPMLFHKTTRRALYTEAMKAANQAGFDDVLFLNLRNEVTESTIGNVFIESRGQWLTPSIDSGLLAGVYRRQLLATRPEIAERVLTLDDLRQADAIYLSNAVRGLRRAIVDWQN